MRSLLHRASVDLQPSLKNVNCALVGDGMVGKTCLTLSYCQDCFMDTYTATIYDHYPVSLSICGEQFAINVADTAGQTDFEDMRTFAYKHSDVLIICFSVCDRDSFLSVCSSWLPEIRKHSKNRKPILLVGTQTDMRSDTSSPDHVSQQEGEELARFIGADAYIECSAKSRQGLQSVFENVVNSALKNKKRKYRVFNRIFRRTSLPF